MQQSNKQLKIAMLGHKRIPSREGGIEIVVEELATRMASLGIGVTCYNRKGHHVSGQKFDTNLNNKNYKGIKIKSVFTIDKKGLAAMTASFFAALRVAFSKYDVVHFHAEGTCVMMWIPKMFGKKCIATIHGLDWARSKWGGFATKYIKLGEKIAVKCADEIIVLSKNVQQYFKDTYNRETVFISNGVCKPEIRTAKEITEKFGLIKDSYVLFLGRIVPEKGVHYLIEAFKNITTYTTITVLDKKNKNFEGENSKNEKNYLAEGIGLGLIFGAAFGSLFNNMGYWIPIGMLFGLIIGQAIKKEE